MLTENGINIVIDHLFHQPINKYFFQLVTNCIKEHSLITNNKLQYLKQLTVQELNQILDKDGTDMM